MLRCGLVVLCGHFVLCGVVWCYGVVVREDGEWCGMVWSGIGVVSSLVLCWLV